MFYNDLTDHFHHADVIMYADDTVSTYADKDPAKVEVARTHSQYEKVKPKSCSLAHRSD